MTSLTDPREDQSIQLQFQDEIMSVESSKEFPNDHHVDVEEEVGGQVLDQPTKGEYIIQAW